MCARPTFHHPSVVLCACESKGPVIAVQAVLTDISAEIRTVAEP